MGQVFSRCCPGRHGAGDIAESSHEDQGKTGARNKYSIDGIDGRETRANNNEATSTELQFTDIGGTACEDDLKSPSSGGKKNESFNGNCIDMNGSDSEGDESKLCTPETTPPATLSKTDAQIGTHKKDHVESEFKRFVSEEGVHDESDNDLPAEAITIAASLHRHSNNDLPAEANTIAASLHRHSPKSQPKQAVVPTNQDKLERSFSDSDSDIENQMTNKNLPADSQSGKRRYIKNSASNGMIKDKHSSKPDKEKHAMVNHAFDDSEEDRPEPSMGLTNQAYSSSSDESCDGGGIQIISSTKKSKELTHEEIDVVDSEVIGFDLTEGVSEGVALPDRNACDLFALNNCNDDNTVITRPVCDNISKHSVIDTDNTQSLDLQRNNLTYLPLGSFTGQQQNEQENKMAEGQKKENGEKRHSTMLQIGRRGEYVESTLVLADPDDPCDLAGNKNKPMSMYGVDNDSESESEDEVEVYYHNGETHQSGAIIKGKSRAVVGAKSEDNMEENREWGSLQYPLDNTTYAIPYEGPKQGTRIDKGKQLKNETFGNGPEENREWGSLQFPTEHVMSNTVLAEKESLEGRKTQDLDCLEVQKTQDSDSLEVQKNQDSDGLGELCINDLPTDGKLLGSNLGSNNVEISMEDGIRSEKKEQFDKKEMELWEEVEKADQRKLSQIQDRVIIGAVDKKPASNEIMSEQNIQDSEITINKCLVRAYAIDSNLSSEEILSDKTDVTDQEKNLNQISTHEVKRRLSISLTDDLSDLSAGFGGEDVPMNSVWASAKREKFKHSVEYSMDSTDMNFKIERLEANLGLLVSEPEKDEESLILVLQILDEICEYRDLMTGIESAREEILPPEITQLRSDLIASGEFTEIEIDENYKDNVTDLNDKTAREFLSPDIKESHVRAILLEHSQRHAELQKKRKKERQDFLRKLETKLNERKIRNLKNSLHKIEELSENESQENEALTKCDHSVKKVLIAREEAMGDIQLHTRESPSSNIVATPISKEAMEDTVETSRTEEQKKKIKAMFSFSAESESEGEGNKDDQWNRIDSDSDSDSECKDGNEDDAKDKNDIRSMYTGLMEGKDSDSDTSSFPSSIIDQLSLDGDTADNESEQDEDENIKTLKLSLQATLTEDIKGNLHSMTANEFGELMTLYRKEQDGLGTIKAGEKDRFNQSLWRKLSETKSKKRDNAEDKGDKEGSEKRIGNIQDSSTQMGNTFTLEDKEVKEMGTGMEDTTGGSTADEFATRDSETQVMEMYQETDRKYKQVATEMDDQFIKSVIDPNKNKIEEVSKLLKGHLDDMEKLRKIKETEIMDHHDKMLEKLNQQLYERQKKLENENRSDTNSSSSDTDLEVDDLHKCGQFEKDLEKLKQLTLEGIDSKKEEVSKEDLQQLLTEYQEKQKALVMRRRHEKEILNEKLREKLAKMEKKRGKIADEIQEQENSIARTMNEMDVSFYRSLAVRNVSDLELETLIAQHLDQVELFKSRVQKEMVRQRQQRNKDKKKIVGQEDFTTLINRQKEQSQQLQKMRQGERENINNKLKEKLDTHKKKEKIKPAKLLLDFDEDSDLEENNHSKNSRSRPVYENVEVSEGGTVFSI